MNKKDDSSMNKDDNKKKKKSQEDFLAGQKKKLKKYKSQLKEELSRIAKEEEGEYHPSFPDYGSGEENNLAEMEDFAENLEIEGKLEQLLKNTEKALKEIGKGTYSRCEDCNGKIKKARLKAYPLATQCIECAKKKPKGWLSRVKKRVWPFNRR